MRTRKRTMMPCESAPGKPVGLPGAEIASLIQGALFLEVFDSAWMKRIETPDTPP